MIRRWQFLMMLAAFAGVSLWAAAQPTPAELALQQRRLDALRKDPEHLARLRENLQTFLRLPDERQQAIVKLDRDLHDLNAKKQDRYLGALARYADWLEHLHKTDPKAWQAIKNAPTAAARLALIKERRNLEWIAGQPKAIREEYHKKMGRDARAAFVVKLRGEERERQDQWLVARRFWKELDSRKALPSRLADFSLKVREYVEKYLLPNVSDVEKEQLASAEGRWPDYPRKLVEIASRRPSALPPPRAEELPTNLKNLPEPVRIRLTEKKGVGGVSKKTFKELQNFAGPNFPSKVVEIALRTNKYPFNYEYWACTHMAMQKPMQEFVTKELTPAIKDHVGDLRKLNDSMGKWPDYPLTIQELSKKHKLRPPWHYLPEPERWKWDLYKTPKYRALDDDAMK